MAYDPLAESIQKQYQNSKKFSVADFRKDMNKRSKEVIKENVNQYIKENDLLMKPLRKAYAEKEHDPVLLWKLFLIGRQVMVDVELEKEQKDKIQSMIEGDFMPVHSMYLDIISSESLGNFVSLATKKKKMYLLISELVGYQNVLNFVSIMFNNTLITRDTSETVEEDMADIDEDIGSEE